MSGIESDPKGSYAEALRVINELRVDRDELKLKLNQAHSGYITACEKHDEAMEELQSKLEAVENKCAAKDYALRMFGKHGADGKDIVNAINAAFSTTAGKGWVKLEWRQTPNEVPSDGTLVIWRGETEIGGAMKVGEFTMLPDDVWWLYASELLEDSK